MPSRLALRAAATSRLAKGTPSRASVSVCLFCSLSRPAAIRRKLDRRPSWIRRAESSGASPSGGERNLDPRKRLEAALGDLRKHAANYVNLSRLQLALRGLNQQPGSETVRVAVLGLTNGSESGHTAKELLRLLLADALKPQEEWERELKNHDTSQPLIIRVARKEEDEGQMAYAKDNVLPEIHVSSPSLNGHNLEILLMEVNPYPYGPAKASIAAFEDAILVPTVDIPTSSSGRYTPITTPVHKAVIVGDGIMGAASIVAMPVLQDPETILAAVNLEGCSKDGSDYPFVRIDVEKAAEGLDLVRDDLGNAMEYETRWYEGNVPTVSEWLKSGIVSDGEGRTKKPVRNLISSLLRSTTAAVQAEEGRRLSSALSSRISPPSVVSLDKALADWAESAHEELQEQLDTAFTGRRWRKLGWWKLFWRVDDVSMLSSEMLSQRFLPEAERGIIYLAGRIEEAGVTSSDPDRPTYLGPVLTPPASENSSEPASPTPELEGKWPTHIPYTRGYLLDKTVPALQALAQKLVIQTLSTSALTSSLATLAYLSSVGAYESGSIAALGIVWSLGRMQKKWETARSYWEGEVREEGRKAIRAVEASVSEVLERSRTSPNEDGGGLDDLTRARRLVQEAEDALGHLK